MHKIMPCLWFDHQAEEAANFYVSVFKNSRLGRIARHTGVGPGQEGTVLTVEFELEGQQFMALNGGPVFQFSPAISLVVNCETQQEIDELWAKLTKGGAEEQCGWLRDKYGVSWQIVPAIVADMMTDSNRERASRVMAEVLKMVKLDIATLRRAYEQG